MLVLISLSLSLTHCPTVSLFLISVTSFFSFLSLSLLIFIGDNRRREILNKTDLSSDGFFSAEGLEFSSRWMAEESFPAAVRDKSLKWLHLHLQMQSADWQRVFRHTGPRRRQFRRSVLHVTTGAQQSHRVQRGNYIILNSSTWWIQVETNTLQGQRWQFKRVCVCVCTLNRTV